VGLASRQLTIVIKETGSSIHAAQLAVCDDRLDTSGARFLLAKSSSCVDSFHVKVSAWILRMSSTMIASDQRAEELLGEINNQYLDRRFADVGSLKHSSNGKFWRLADAKE